MDKPTLLLNTGCGWAATTPMWLTLQRDNRYCHTGHRKEPLWLPQCHYQGAYEEFDLKSVVQLLNQNLLIMYMILI